MKSVISSDQGGEPVTLRGYLTGFVLSLLTTGLAYVVATQSGYGQALTVGLVGGLALIQFVVQAVYFLHILDGGRPRWRLGIFIFMLSVVVVVVFGSLWIMHNLDYRMMHSPTQTEEYLKDQDGGI